jgi:predicted RNA-binding Zn-ribbon protein involved in translation (DUF1610 family)
MEGDTAWREFMQICLKKEICVTMRKSLGWDPSRKETPMVLLVSFDDTGIVVEYEDLSTTIRAYIHRTDIVSISRSMIRQKAASLKECPKCNKNMRLERSRYEGGVLHYACPACGYEVEA